MRYGTAASRHLPEHGFLREPAQGTGRFTYDPASGLVRAPPPYLCSCAALLPFHTCSRSRTNSSPVFASELQLHAEQRVHSQRGIHIVIEHFLIGQIASLDENADRLRQIILGLQMHVDLHVHMLTDERLRAVHPVGKVARSQYVRSGLQQKLVPVPVLERQAGRQVRQTQIIGEPRRIGRVAEAVFRVVPTILHR